MHFYISKNQGTLDFQIPCFTSSGEILITDSKPEPALHPEQQIPDELPQTIKGDHRMQETLKENSTKIQDVSHGQSATLEPWMEMLTITVTGATIAGIATGCYCHFVSGSQSVFENSFHPFGEDPRFELIAIE